MTAMPTMREAAFRALRGRCPCCGEGKLFRSYLKQVDRCSVCSESFGAIRADDAAPWLTIIVVGHVFLPLAFTVDLGFLPFWAEMASLTGVFVLLSLLLLPRAKGLFIAILWMTRAPGYNAPESETAG
jgi:uncharacterized protein (DUF983 family)